MAEEIKALGKSYLEKLIYNPILLIRKKIIVLIEYNNKTLTRSEMKGQYTSNDNLGYYRPYVDSTQFWTFENNQTTEAALHKRDLIDLEVELEITDPARSRYDKFLRLVLVPESTMFFNNMNTNDIKLWLYTDDWYEIWIAVACLLFNFITRYICIREGRPYSPESICYDNYDKKSGLDFRFMFFQQITLYLVAISYCMRNSPLLLCIFYVVYSFVCHLIRSKVVVLRFRLRLLSPISVELREGQESLPSNWVYCIVSSTCFIALVIVVGLLWSEYRSRAAFPDLSLMGDLLYILQFLNSIQALTLVVSAYRADNMKILPWRLLIVKGVINFAELLLFDINELPSFAMTSYVRDDFVLLSAFVFYGFNIESHKYEAKMKYIMAKQRYLEEQERREEENRKRQAEHLDPPRTGEVK